jgi:hypothetical protein
MTPGCCVHNIDRPVTNFGLAVNARIKMANLAQQGYPVLRVTPGAIKQEGCRGLRKATEPWYRQLTIRSCSRGTGSSKPSPKSTVPRWLPARSGDRELEKAVRYCTTHRGTERGQFDESPPF